MRMLLIGATGFIGSAVLTALLNAGHQVLASYHRSQGPTRHNCRWIRLDMARATPQVWTSLLTGIDAVVNCAGVLQDNAWESTRAVHRDAVKALVDACERANVPRLVHLSAIGVQQRSPTEFSRTKREAEDYIGGSTLDWVILRPAVVVGDGAFGASALFRGLAALAWLPVMPDTGHLQIVQRRELVATILRLCQQTAPARIALDIAGPERLSMTEIVASYRAWLGFPPARTFAVPQGFARPLYRMGDMARMLGWRPPLGTTARIQMRDGAVGDIEPWKQTIGIEPKSLEAALAERPASVQERWFARLYFLKPLALVVFAAFWIATGLISLTSGYQIGVNLMLEAGAGPLAGPAVIAGAIADICVGIAISFRRSARLGLWGAVALTLFYAVAGSILVPRLWNEPLGPLLKIWPILMLNFMLLATLDER